MILSNDVPRLLFWDGVFADVGCERSMPTRLTKPCNDRRAVSFLSVASVVSLESLEADGRGEITERSGFIGVAYDLYNCSNFDTLLHNNDGGAWEKAGGREAAGKDLAGWWICPLSNGKK